MEIIAWRRFHVKKKKSKSLKKTHFISRKKFQMELFVARRRFHVEKKKCKCLKMKTYFCDLISRKNFKMAGKTPNEINCFSTTFSLWKKRSGKKTHFCDFISRKNFQMAGKIPNGCTTTSQKKYLSPKNRGLWFHVKILLVGKYQMDELMIKMSKSKNKDIFLRKLLN